MHCIEMNGTASRRSEVVCRARDAPEMHVGCQSNARRAAWLTKGDPLIGSGRAAAGASAKHTLPCTGLGSRAVHVSPFNIHIEFFSTT